MAKVYFESTDTAFTVNNNNTAVYGASGDQTITVVFGVTGLTADQNIEKVIFSKTSSDYTYKQSGNQIQLYFGGVLVTSIPVQGDSDGTELIFANGSANALLANGVMTIGKASSYTPIDANTGTFDSKLVIPDPTPTPTPDPTPAPDPTPPAPPSDTTAPTLTSSTPADDATNVAIGANIVLTMSENVTAVAGKNIIIKKLNGDIVSTIDAADAQITGSGTSTITINPTADLGGSTEYYVLIDSGAFKDSANNDYTGISSTTALSFTTEADTTAPTLASSTPADDATNVAIGANIVLTMSENVTAVAGKNITIKKLNGDIVTTIAATDAQITGSGTSTITINPTDNLGSSMEYYILIDSGAFKDGANNDYAGISATTDFSFTTADATAPTLTSSTPTDDATNVALSANIVLTMSENVTAVAGKNITIKKLNGDIVTTIAATDAQITGSGSSTITINPTADLGGSTEYYVLIDSGAFKDGANNNYAGISATTALSFTTEADTTAPTLASSTPADDATAVAANANIVLTMSENVTAVTGKNIEIKKTSDNSTVTTIDALDSQVTISANAVTINPASDLATDTEYYVLIDSGAFKDSSNNVYTGISSSTALSFKTADTTAPTLTSSTPIDNATAVAIGANIVLTMSENVTAVGGKNIIIKKTSDNSTIATIDAADAQITGSGTSTITINPTSDLAVGTEYYVLIDSGAFKDLANNDYAGISSATALGFKTDPVVYLTKIAAGTGGFAINGEASNNRSGYSVASAGDVNGDGLADLIVGAYLNGTVGFNAGRSYVVFGKSDGAVVSLATIAIGTSGFAINAEAASDFSGGSVSSAGDVNGDGLADLIVGAYGNSSNAGRSYVVFGKNSDTNAVSLNSLGTGGFAINGEAASDMSGFSVSSAGDVNGDGLADLIIGAGDSSATDSYAGRSYVVFGKNSNTTAVSLATIAAGTGGFAINGQASNDNSGNSVSSAGDVNGDGLADLIVGAKNNDTGAADAGRSYVVFGKSDGGVVSLATIAAGTGGFAINGEAASDMSGNSVSSAGDVNGDGLADLIVGAPYNDTGAAGAGRSYIIFGKTNTDTVSLSTIASGTGGFAINGQATNDYSGYSVSSAGDVNGDGLADLIVGAYGNNTGSSDAGRSYVVFGKSDTTAVSPTDIASGIGGFAINGQAASNNSGYSVSSAGDVNGDGLADLIVGAYGNTSNTGKSYVIFGGTQWLTTNVSGAGTVTGTAANEAIIGSSSSDTLTGGGGIDRFYAGDSNDVIVLTASDIANLADNTTGSPKAVINGGGDIDTIRLTAGASLDLTAIRNQGAGGVEENSRIESIEKIDLATDTAANSLTLRVNDVIDMSGMNLFNTGSSWTVLGASVLKHQIVIDGTSADSLIINAGNGVWASGSNVTDGTNTYNVYDNVASNAQILVLDGVVVTNNDV